MEGQGKKKKIDYPYIPQGRTIEYCSAGHPSMKAAQKIALETSLDKNQATGSVIEINGEIIGMGVNGSTYHEEYGCERVKLGIGTGQGYELCEGCHPKNHSERRAIESVPDEKKHLIKGADLYLWGHWWCCKDCWDAIIAAGINKVILQDESNIDFDRNNPNNRLAEINSYRQRVGP